MDHFQIDHKLFHVRFQTFCELLDLVECVICSNCTLLINNGYPEDKCSYASILKSICDIFFMFHFKFYFRVGFKMYVSRSGAYKPSYKLKSGMRSSGPGGGYDGTYTADYVSAASKVGDLDECNGAYAEEIGEYVYFITEAFPFAPRCLMGQADRSFARKGPGSSGSDGRRLPPRGMKGPPPPRPF